MGEIGGAVVQVGQEFSGARKDVSKRLWTMWHMGGYGDSHQRKAGMK